VRVIPEVTSAPEENMDRNEVITILESLANGVDPGTGTRIPLETFHAGDTVRALFTATALLRNANTAPAMRQQRAGTTTLTAAGSAWSAEEDARLGEEFDAGMTVAQIALQHGRTSGAITSRLVKIGRLDPATVKSRERGARMAS
jgi:hypothetical protein